MIVEMIAVDTPTIRLFRRSRWTSLFPSTYSYHRRLKPSHWVTRRAVPLKLNTTTTTIGRYRNR
jgi:hypothetical protein